MQTNTIWIKLSKDIYSCGEPVQGTVNVVCLAPAFGQQLQLKIKGKEQTKWVDLVHIHENPQIPLNIPPQEIERVEDVNLTDDSSDSDDDSKGHQKKKFSYIRRNNNQLFQVKRGKGDHKITDQVQTLGQLQPGQYQFPFQFNSQKSWPGSFLNEQKKERGRIKYTLEAKYGNAKSKTEFFLQETKVSESDKHSVNAKVSSWCCIGQGNVQMDVSFAKDSLYIGEEQTVNIKLDCTNLSVNINSLNVVLNNHLLYRSNDGNTLSRSHPVYHKSLQGCIAKGVKEFTEKFLVEFKDNKYSIRPTCHGKLINSTYILSVGAANDATCDCCSDSAVVGNDTHIYSKPLIPASSNVFSLPNFVPIVQPAVSIVVQNFVAQVIPISNQMPQPQMNNQFQQPQSQQQPLMQPVITPQQPGSNQVPQYPPQNQVPVYTTQNQPVQYPPQNQPAQYPPPNQAPIQTAQIQVQQGQQQYPPQQNAQPQAQQQNGQQYPPQFNAPQPQIQQQQKAGYDPNQPGAFVGLQQQQPQQNGQQQPAQFNAPQPQVQQQQKAGYDPNQPGAFVGFQQQQPQQNGQQNPSQFNAPQPQVQYQQQAGYNPNQPGAFVGLQQQQPGYSAQQPGAFVGFQQQNH